MTKLKMPNHCLMFLTEFPPINSAGVHRSLRFVRNLPEFDWEPTVIARSPPHYSAQHDEQYGLSNNNIHRVEDLKLAGKTSNNNEQVASIKRTATFAQQINSIKSILRPISQLITETPDRNRDWVTHASNKGLELCRNHPFQVVFSSGPPHSTHLAAAKCARKFKIPWIADFRDPWARAPWKRTNNPIGRKLLPWYESFVIKHASRVILNTEPSLSDFSNAYDKYKEKFCWIPNGLDPEVLATVNQLERRKASKPTQITICHPGSLYGHRNPKPVLEAIKSLRQTGLDIRLEQIGNASPELDPKLIAADLGIDAAVECLGSLSHAETLSQMKEADLLLVIQPDAPLMVPGKVYEMLAFDAPIIACCDSEATEKIVTQGGGYCAPSRNPQQIRDMISDAIRNGHSPEKNNMRLESRKTFCGKRLTQKFADVMNGLM